VEGHDAVKTADIVAALTATDDAGKAKASELLAAATGEQLAEARAEIVKAAGSFKGATPENVSALGAHIAGIEAIDAQETANKATADKYAADQAKLAELANLGSDPTGQPLRPANPSQEDAPENPEDGEQPPATDPNADPNAGNGEGSEGGDGVQAAAGSRRRQLGNLAYGVQPGAGEGITGKVVSLHRSFGVQEGAELDRRGVAQSFSQALEQVGRVPGDSIRVPLVRLATKLPDSRQLSGTDSWDNMLRMESVIDSAKRGTRESLVAAGGFCSPLQTLYDIPVIGDTDRPVRDALARFQADRGGIQYRPAVSGVAQTGGIGVWTAADDVNASPTPKSCAIIDCPGVVTAQVEAIYQCLKFTNMAARFDPEYADSVVRAQAIAHARFAENRLLTRLTTASTRVQSKQLLGAVRDSLATVDHVVAYYRSVHRLNAEARLRMILPQWMFYMLATDLARQMVGDGLQVFQISMEQVQAWFATRNVAITWHLDGIDPADITTPALVIPPQVYSPVVADQIIYPFPDVVSALLFAEGDWLLLDGGTLDLGIVRDSTLVGLNQYETFSESFEYAAFRGIESLHIAMALNPTGASAATVATETIATTVAAGGTAGD
jgi:hypothetical protein